MSIDLTTNYLGLKLRNPLVISACPASMEIHSLERLKAAGAASLAATSGIQEGADMLKVLLAGADVGMLASALIRNGPDHLAKMLTDMTDWLP